MSKRLGMLVVIILAVMALTSSVFTVHEGRQALLFQFGHMQVDSNEQAVVLQPGLHVKLPFVARARQFDTRVQTLLLNVPAHLDKSGLDGNAEYNVYWQINNLAQFYQSTGGDWAQVDTLLSQSLIGHLSLQPTAAQTSDSAAQASVLAEKLGIKIIAINYKGLALSQNAMNATYQLMREAQEQQAKKIRLDAKLSADKILSDAQDQSTIVLAQGQANASSLRAQGDAQASTIYANAYSKDPEFYAFLINLDAYGQTFNSKEDVFVLTPDMQFFHYFNQPQKQEKSKS